MLDNLQGVKLENIPDIPCGLPAWTQVRSVSRSGSFAPRIWLSQEPVCSTRIYSGSLSVKGEQVRILIFFD
jgi:hypothetical protein